MQCWKDSLGRAQVFRSVVNNGGSLAKQCRGSAGLVQDEHHGRRENK